jgi:formylglycine-generating enzyme required for sulfatase activity
MSTPFGLVDIHGDVFDRCQDEDRVEEEAGPAGDDAVSNSNDRLVRGGGFVSHSRHLRSAGR